MAKKKNGQFNRQKSNENHGKSKKIHKKSEIMKTRKRKWKKFTENHGKSKKGHGKSKKITKN